MPEVWAGGRGVGLGEAADSPHFATPKTTKPTCVAFADSPVVATPARMCGVVCGCSATACVRLCGL